MDTLTFDAVARRAARALDRRSLLGLVASSLVAGGFRPVAACKPGHSCGGGGNGNNHQGGGGGKNKKDKKDKKCRKQATACIAAVAAYCTAQYGFDITQNNLCRLAHHECCGLYRDCKTAKADQCIREVPY